MAIVINDQYRLRQENFLDDRQGIAESISSLKSWDFENVPIPSGFKVFVDGVWYIFKVEFEEDEITGKFRRVTDDLGIEGLTERVDTLEEKESLLEEKVDFEIDIETAPTFGDIVTPAFWKDEQEVLHIKPGKRVTVTSDPDPSKNGVWFLSNENFQLSESWIKLVSRADLIKTTDTTTPSDENIYTAANTDNLFPKKAGDEVISGSWKFAETATFEKDIIVHGVSKVSVHDVIAENVKSENGEFRHLRVTEDLTSEGSASLNRLSVSGRSILGKDNSFGNNGSIKDVLGKTIATFDKIVASESEISDIDEKIEEKLGYLGVGNLLKNTSFWGRSQSEEFNEESVLSEDYQVFSDALDDWGVTTGDCKVLPNTNYITGFCVLLPTELSQISQKSVIPLTKGAEYVLSWKAKYTITPSIDEIRIRDIDIKMLPGIGESEYKTYYVRIKSPEDMYITVRFSGGAGYVGEIKLEMGIIPTSWFPCPLDTDPVAKLIFRYEYLNTAFEEYTRSNDDTVSSILLKNQIKIGEYINGGIEKFYGGISGIVSNPSTDVMMWSGSSFREAQDLVYRVYKNPNYLDDLSYSELQTLAKMAVTFGAKTIMTDLYAAGKFKGQHLDTDGSTIKSFNVISGNIPCNTGSGVIGLKMKGGLLIGSDGKYANQTITSINPGTSQTRTLTFLNGKCAITDPSNAITIWTGSGTLTLRFRDGYLVKVSEGNDNSSTYYWY